MTNIRLDPKERRSLILQSALKVAEKNHQFTFNDVAKEAGVTAQLIVHYFTSKAQLQREIMRAALKQNIVPIVARGLVLGDRRASKASPELRALAQEYLAKRTA